MTTRYAERERGTRQQTNEETDKTAKILKKNQAIIEFCTYLKYMQSYASLHHLTILSLRNKYTSSNWQISNPKELK